jgi:hypothetical protein
MVDAAEQDFAILYRYAGRTRAAGKRGPQIMDSDRL